MREGLIDILRCPRCRSERALELTVHVRDEREVREGSLTCGHCGGSYAVADGIVDLLHEPPEFVQREAAGLARFAEVMRKDGWDRERILALPDVELDYWRGQGAAMRALLDAVDLQPGRRILDVGSNTCWASNVFARRGLEVVALDIAKTELQGLRTAEYFLDQGEVHFERLLSVMFDPALASESMDYAFCCEVLHHNDSANLRRTMRELYRVLRPGGLLLVINEPLRFPFNLKRDHAQEVAEFEGYEHVFFCHQYYLAARRAGFKVRVRPPVSDRRSRHPLARRVALAYRTLLTGDASLNMIATKPGPLRPGDAYALRRGAVSGPASTPSPTNTKSFT